MVALPPCCQLSCRWFILGFACSYIVLRSILSSSSSPSAQGMVRLVPSHARAPHSLQPIGPEQVSLLSPPRPTTRSPPSPAGRHSECVDRVTAAPTARVPPTLPNDIVLAVMTTVKRHGLLNMMRKNWLRDARAVFLTDAPGLEERPNQQVVIWPGNPECGAADRGAPTIHFANVSSRLEGFKWVIMVDDDVLVNTANLARFLSAYDPDVPLWFTAHGCTPSYVRADGGRVAPCVAQHAPRGCRGCNGKRSDLAGGLKAACRAARSPFVTNDTTHNKKGWSGRCAAYPEVEGLRTFGSEVGQSYCGGTGCVFSRAYLAGLPSSEVFRSGSACQGCTRGQQDVLLSRCLFHHHPAAIAPIGLSSFFWGRPAERLVEQFLEHYPACLKETHGGPLGGAREAYCVRRHGLMEWFSLHLQVRGAFTTLDSDREVAPAAWASTFRHGKRAVPVEQLLQVTNDLERQVRSHAEAQRSLWASRLCCGLLRRELVPCNLGCAPWRTLSGYANGSGAAAVRTGSALNGVAEDSETLLQCASGESTRVWEQPAPRGGEDRLLFPHERQTWPNGAMRCDWCEGYFNGWRGY